MNEVEYLLEMACELSTLIDDLEGQLSDKAIKKIANALNVICETIEDELDIISK